MNAPVLTAVKSRPDLARPDLWREAAFVAGEWRKSDRTIAVDNPATGEIIGHVPDFGAAETDEAVTAATAAFVTCAKRPARNAA